MNHSWQDVILALIAATPAIIAAVSSLRNGRVIRKTKSSVERIENGQKKKKVKPNLKNGDTASNPEWYKPPELL